MLFKIKSCFLFIVVIFLQSCSGGRIGNFLESSFSNKEEVKIEEGNKIDLEVSNIIGKEEALREKRPKTKKAKIEDISKSNLKTNNLIKEENLKEKRPKIKKLNNDEKLKSNFKKEKIFESLENKKINKLKVRKFEPQSYKIIFILKDVDPKDPIENLSTILRNSDVNFEIEKIERYFEKKNKVIKKN